MENSEGLQVFGYGRAGRERRMMRSVRGCTALLLAAVLVACSGRTERPGTSGDGDHSAHATHGPRHDTHGDHAEHVDLEPGEPSRHSIYHSSGVWLNRYGEEIALSDLRGKVQIVTMVYTWCEYACPRILADMKRIERLLTPEERLRSNFVLVSIDPERDTPGRLAEFAEQNNLDPANWTLLNGKSGDTLELAALLGVRYRRISETDFAHSNMIIVLNQEGEIVHQRVRIGEDPGQTVQEIRRLISSR